MQMGMVGLGRMGANMVRRLLRAEHEIVVWDRTPAVAAAMEAEGATGVASFADFREALQAPRTIWIMLPAGEPTEDAIAQLKNILDPGDCLVDGGNSYFKDDVRRAESLKEKGIHYMDVGVSGGIWGLERGYCLMIGGEPKLVAHLDPIFATLAPGKDGTPPTPGRCLSTTDNGYLHCGPVGSGHFVKMVHNGIEYGVMQAYAEGFDILKNAAHSQLPENMRYHLRLEEISEVWRHGSVVSSWLLDLSARALNDDPSLSHFEGYVQDSGEGRWTVQAALDEAVPADVLATALFVRFRSRQTHTFAEKLLSAMRQGFGGHKEPK